MIKSFFLPYVVRFLTSERWQHLRELPGRWKQRFSSDKPVVELFHQLNDPYSYLALEASTELLKRYRIALKITIVADEPLPNKRQEHWHRYRLHDARRLARAWRMNDFVHVDAPDPAALQKSLASLPSVPANVFFKTVLGMTRALWNNDIEALESVWGEFRQSDDKAIGRLTQAGNQRRHELGHYQAGTWFFEGNWYQGLDRLQFLEDDLQRWGLFDNTATISGENFTPRLMPALEGTCLDVFFSFRSPYSYLALERLFAMMEHSPRELRLRPIMPMVNRGVPLSPEKKKYLLLDSARVARKLDIPFGFFHDPLGPGIKDLMALFYYAQEMKVEQHFVLSVMKGIWSEAANINNQRTLSKLCTRAGLNWDKARHRLFDAEPQELVERNAQQLEMMGLWGVPTFALTNKDNRLLDVYWGQDRLTWLQYGLTGPAGQ